MGLNSQLIVNPQLVNPYQEYFRGEFSNRSTIGRPAKRKLPVFFPLCENDKLWPSSIDRPIGQRLRPFLRWKAIHTFYPILALKDAS